MSERRRGIWEMIGAMVISGTVGWFVLFSGEQVISVVFWRCVIGSATLLAVCFSLGYLQKGVLTRKQFILAVLAGIALVGNWVLLFSSYAHASISVSTAVYNVQPFILVIFGTLFFHEQLTLTKIFWLVLAFAGVILIVQAKPEIGYGSGHYLLGIALAISAAFLYAVASIITKALKGVPPHLIALVQITMGAIMLAPFAMERELPANPQAWAAIGTIGLVHTGLMYILLYGAIQKLPTNLTGSLSFIYPAVAVLVDYLALGHSLQPVQLAGIAAILLSAAGMTLGWSFKRRHGIEAQMIACPGSTEAIEREH